MHRFSDAEVDAALSKLPEWSRVGECIQRTYAFEDFVQSMTFVNGIAQHAEAVQHHPDFLVRWSKVTLSLSTHDVGGISEKDALFAAHADAAAAAFSTR
ncbi:MAG: 4a-hydroxytetrahydrobiopterin dehydratase [Phycisphaerae bacterium]|nr:4a-hydroxytetrahydrobiopterin dehydratase [Phycisphaerae bacterium]